MRYARFHCVTKIAFTFLMFQALTVYGAGDLDMAPPVFLHKEGNHAVFVDFQQVTTSIVFDAEKKVATGKSKIIFHLKGAGYPIFDLVPMIKSISLDGESLNPKLVKLTQDPHITTKFLIVEKVVPADNKPHQLEIEYQLSPSSVTFIRAAVRMGFFMSDLSIGGRHYLEQYEPTSFEYDHYSRTLDIRVINSDLNHEIFTNGNPVVSETNHWTVEYPPYFTTSSPFFHIAERGRFVTTTANYPGVKATIPVTVYGETRELVDNGNRLAFNYLRELEATYGAFAHPKLLIYIVPTGGGMEYCGATMSSTDALGHEITHSWFARGVMPADGNAGWIDEATARWRDYNYPRNKPIPEREGSNLGGFSPYMRHTTDSAYEEGQQLLSETDYLAQNKGGLKPILKAFYGTYKWQSVSVPMFQKFLEASLGQSLQTMFDRFVYGKGLKKESPFLENALPIDMASKPKGHPRRFTDEELKRYR